MRQKIASKIVRMVGGMFCIVSFIIVLGCKQAGNTETVVVAEKTKSAVTVGGIVSAVGIVIILVWAMYKIKQYLGLLFGNKLVKTKPTYVDCIRYRDLYAFYQREDIQQKLASNKNLKLFAQKEDVTDADGKKKVCVTMFFFDSVKQNSVPIENGLCLMSEKLDDILEKEFSVSSIYYMRDPNL